MEIPKTRGLALFVLLQFTAYILLDWLLFPILIYKYVALQTFSGLMTLCILFFLVLLRTSASYDANIVNL